MSSSNKKHHQKQQISINSQNNTISNSNASTTAANDAYVGSYMNSFPTREFCEEEDEDEVSTSLSDSYNSREGAIVNNISHNNNNSHYTEVEDDIMVLNEEGNDKGESIDDRDTYYEGSDVGMAAISPNSVIDEDTSDDKPRILLMGLKKSGKSSIQKVVFHKMSPNESLFLEGTTHIVKEDLSDVSFIRFRIWDIPGHLKILNNESIDVVPLFINTSAIIYVIDASDDYSDSIQMLLNVITSSFHINPKLNYEVFVHKVDCLTDEQKYDIFNEISHLVMDYFKPSPKIRFYPTTIYDHSVFEAFSQVVQSLLRLEGTFEKLLDIFKQNSMLEKAFLFDVSSKIYLATDSTFVDMQTYELCCDMIDVVIDITSIYNPSMENETFFNDHTSSMIKLCNDTVLYLRGINKHLAIVCIMRSEALQKMGVIEYNFQQVKKGLLEILNVKGSC